MWNDKYTVRFGVNGRMSVVAPLSARNRTVVTAALVVGTLSAVLAVLGVGAGTGFLVLGAVQAVGLLAVAWVLSSDRRLPDWVVRENGEFLAGHTVARGREFVLDDEASRVVRGMCA